MDAYGWTRRKDNRDRLDRRGEAHADRRRLWRGEDRSPSQTARRHPKRLLSLLKRPVSTAIDGDDQRFKPLAVIGMSDDGGVGSGRRRVAARRLGAERHMIADEVPPTRREDVDEELAARWSEFPSGDGHRAFPQALRVASSAGGSPLLSACAFSSSLRASIACPSASRSTSAARACWNILSCCFSSSRT